MREQTIFIEALEIEDEAERSAYLDRACAGDEALRQRLDRLLARHAQSGFLDRPALAPAATGAYTSAPAECAGAEVGPYKLLQSIGDGGMGSVWMAEQREPVRRLVALKIIRQGM